jgi:hypothetical protein
MLAGRKPDKNVKTKMERYHSGHQMGAFSIPAAQSSGPEESKNILSTEAKAKRCTRKLDLTTRST